MNEFVKQDQHGIHSSDNRDFWYSSLTTVFQFAEAQPCIQWRTLVAKVYSMLSRTLFLYAKVHGDHFTRKKESISRRSSGDYVIFLSGIVAATQLMLPIRGVEYEALAYDLSSIMNRKLHVHESDAPPVVNPSKISLKKPTFQPPAGLRGPSRARRASVPAFGENSFASPIEPRVTFATYVPENRGQFAVKMERKDEYPPGRISSKPRMRSVPKFSD